MPNHLVHTVRASKKGVSAIRFFPVSGHLLLSAALDSRIKIWEVGGDRRCLRVYSGHAEAVRDISFAPDGKTFLSVSYDKFVKIWDTETGQVISRHTNRDTPLCARFHPTRAGEFLAGMRGRVIQQWDARSNEIVQTYDEHLGAVNSVTFLADNTRFVSSSDDNKLLVWEYGIPTVTKHIAHPTLHSIPKIAMHPGGKYFAGNALDNKVLVFECANRVKMKRNKSFTGHSTAGFTCGLTFSPDGQFLASGDGLGRLFFWDWRSGRLLSRIGAHPEVSIEVAWHPADPSLVASCSWDGTIKYWKYKPGARQ